MIQQAVYFFQDVNSMLGKYKFRIIHIWLSRGFCGILLYRMERGLYLGLGKTYKFIRIFFIPLFNLMQAYSNIDIHYEADIKGGIKILHPSTGIVVSGCSKIGKNLTLTGGNIIGAKGKCKAGDLKTGDNCTLGANAVVLGPIQLGNNINIGACACVTKSFAFDSITLAGVPASIIKHSEIQLETLENTIN